MLNNCDVYLFLLYAGVSRGRCTNHKEREAHEGDTGMHDSDVVHFYCRCHCK